MSQLALAQTVQAAPQAQATAGRLLQRQCDCGTHTHGQDKCGACEDKAKTLRRSGSSGALSTAPGIVHDVLARPGRPLDTEALSFLEPRFGAAFIQVAPTAAQPMRMPLEIGAANDPLEDEADSVAGRVLAARPGRSRHDFSVVRIHTDVAAARSAEAMDALAYTVGSHVVFGAGAYAPHTQAGRGLLAHELAHVVQQGSDRTPRPQTLQRSVGGFFRNLGRSIVSLFTDEPDISDDVLQRYLAVIDTGRIEDDYDSDDKARIVVRRWRAGAVGFALSQERKAMLIREMLSGYVSDDDEIAILALLENAPEGEMRYILTQVPPAKLRARLGSDARQRLERVLPQDLLAGVHPVTANQQAQVEHVLNPTTTVTTTPAPPAAAGAPAAPPTITVHDAPAMTDVGPGGDFETKMLGSLNANIGFWASKFRTLRAQPGQPAFPIAGANTVADAAQEETESYFRPYIRVASRKPTDHYHPGAYTLESKLGDESTRPQTDADRRGWLNYWMTLSRCPAAPCGQSILDQKHFSAGRASDDTEIARVRDLYLSTHVTDVDDAIHSWPAEAGSGTVFIQPYQNIPTQEERRRKRWDLFTTLIHEMMHILAHPNFATAADRIGGTGQKILTEGMAEVMRTELWSGPGHLQSRVGTSEMAPLRQKVEGAAYPYDPAVVVDHGYYPELAKAQTIDTTVGHENAKAAFFLGHVELLGLGAGTRHQSSLAGVAMYQTSDTADAQVIVATAGDTYDGLLARTGASAGKLLDDATGNPLAAGAALAPGTRVRVPGISWVRAIDGDTLGSIAQQNNVPLTALATANGFAVGAPPATPLPISKRILIPIPRNPT